MRKNKIIISIITIVVFIVITYIQNSNILSSTFPTETKGLPTAEPTKVVELKNGDTYNMEISEVKKIVNGKELRMLAYNGMIPGPTIKATQGAEVTINLKNNSDVDTSLHSHGLRLDSQYDGVIGMDQDAIKPGESFTYKIKFPDAGIFWYHPHYREDYAQELGLYGNYLVTSKDPNYLSPVNKEETVTLDDILLDDANIALFSKSNVDYALMGRFGNTMFTNGESQYSLSANTGDVVRLYFTNVANARPFSISIPNAKMKLVASDMGKYEHETFVDNVIVGPSERMVADVYFPKSGSYQMMNTNPLRSYILGTIDIKNSKSLQSYASEFYTLRTNNDVIADIDSYRKYFDKAPDKKLRLTINMGGNGSGGGMGMHRMPDGTIMSNDGMTMHSDTDDGIEWEDTMHQMNKISDARTEWQIADENTGRKNMGIDWVFQKDGVSKIEIYNDPHAMHPMQHPIHFHGQRFLILSRNGVPEKNLVWKDTVLIPAGQKVELLFDASNPGNWMAHCHIAEHLEAGMMFNFSVK